jgi:ribonuclease HI
LIEVTPWALFFDGSSCGKGGGVGILLISPRGEMFEFAIPIQPTFTNNQADYEALLRGASMFERRSQGPFQLRFMEIQSWL